MPDYIELLIDDKLCNIIQKLWTDPEISFFYDRTYPGSIRSRLNYWRKSQYAPHGLMNYWAQCFSWAIDEYSKITRTQPSHIQTASTPHAPEWYVRLKVAELCGVPLYIFHNSRIAGYSYVCRSMSRKPDRVPINELDKSTYIHDAESYIAKCITSYEQAMPEYERERLVRQKGKYFKLTRLISDFWSRPRWIFNALECWSALSRISVPLKDIKSDSYAVFFLHYQPERTTQPEAYGFSQQIRAILSLRASLPKDCLLLVKEHPSIFSNQCDARFRSKEFYDTVNKIPGVQWVRIDSNNFDLIDSSCVTASICGTANTESLIRGVPTILFGIQKFEDVYGQHFFRNNLDLRDFLLDAFNKKIDSDKIRCAIISSIKNDGFFTVPDKFIDTPIKRERYIADLLAKANPISNVDMCL